MAEAHEPPQRLGRPLEANRQQRIAGDEALIAQLRREGFYGQAWDRFANALADYGFSVMFPWIFTGEVVQRCREKHIRCTADRPRNDRPWARQDAEEIACETVAMAINAFRDVLRQGRWSPSGGATIRTFFVGQCLMQYSNAYRRWKRETEPLSTVVYEDSDQLDAALDLPDTGADSDPEYSAIVNDELRRTLGQIELRTRQALQFRALGYSNVEIADLLDVAVTTVERIFRRHRRTISHTTHDTDLRDQSLRRQSPLPDGGGPDNERP